MRSKFWFVAGIMAVLITACTLPTSSPPAPAVQTWFDIPLSSPKTIPEAPYKLLFHGASPMGIQEFELKINSVFEATVLPSLFSGNLGQGGENTLLYGEYLWKPPSPGTYVVEVRAKQAGNGFGSPVQVTIIVEGQDPVVAEIVTPLQIKCVFEAAVNLFCREGPGQIYPEIDSMVAGEMGEVVGISEDGQHVYLIGPNTGRQCAVPNATRYGGFSGNCDGLPVLPNPPLPEEIPTEAPIATDDPFIPPIIIIFPTDTPIPPPN